MAKNHGKKGHNSGDTSETGGVSGKRLKAFVERIERLEEEKSALGEDIKEIYAEAKGMGFDCKTIRQCVRIRKMDKELRREQEELLQTYLAALGLD